MLGGLKTGDGDVALGGTRQRHGGELARGRLRFGLDGAGAHGKDRAGARGGGGRLEGATEDDVGGGVIRVDGRDVREDAGGQACGNAAGNLVAGGRRGDDDGRGVRGAEGVEGVDLGCDEALAVVGRGGLNDLGGAELGELLLKSCRRGGDDDGRDDAQRAGGGDELGGDR